MKTLTPSNFGLLIGFILPGFTALWGVSYFSSTVDSWLGGSDPATVGGFLYVTIASVGAGLTVSAVRWIVIDRIHHHTGIPFPNWDFSRLQKNVSAFNVLIEIHYRHYQFYANMLIASIFTYVCRRASLGFFSTAFSLTDLAFGLVMVVFAVTSRDTLRKYYQRGSGLLGSVSTAGFVEKRMEDAPQTECQAEPIAEYA